jgi:hypothetical protein
MDFIVEFKESEGVGAFVEEHELAIFGGLLGEVFFEDIGDVDDEDYFL